MRAIIAAVAAGLGLVGLSGCIDAGPYPATSVQPRPYHYHDHRGSRRVRQPALDHADSARCQRQPGGLLLGRYLSGHARLLSECPWLLAAALSSLLGRSIIPGISLPSAG